MIKIPEKFIRRVKEIKEKQGGKDKPYNPYAVCRKSTGYFGTSHDIGLLHPKKKK